MLVNMHIFSVHRMWDLPFFLISYILEREYSYFFLYPLKKLAKHTVIGIKLHLLCASSLFIVIKQEGDAGLLIIGWDNKSQV